MKNNQKKDSKREPLPGSPEARPEGGRSKGDTSKTGHANVGKKTGDRNKADRSAEDDGMPSGAGDSDRDNK